MRVLLHVLHPPLSECNTPFDHYCLNFIHDITHELYHAWWLAIARIDHVIQVVNMPMNMKKFQGWGLGMSYEPNYSYSGHII